MSETAVMAMDPSVRATIFGAAVGLMALEYSVSTLARHDAETHDRGETAAGFGVAIGRPSTEGERA